MTTSDPTPTAPVPHVPPPGPPPGPPMGGPSYDDDLVEELRARGRTRPPTVTLVLASALLLAIGFVGGTWAQRTFGGASAASALGSAPAGARASGDPYAGGGFPGRGGSGQGGGATIGTVKLVDGDTLYVRDGSGKLVKVKVTGSTTVRITKSGKVSQLKPGQRVVAQGKKGSDGTVTATTISSGGGRGGGGGQGPN